MVRTVVFAIFALSACDGLPENEFIGQYEDIYCSGYQLCATDEMLRTVGQRECLQYYRAQEYPSPPECPYDAVAAEECVAEFASSGCLGDDPEVPVICKDVYSACDMPRLPPAEGPEFETEAE